jgi:hypothetical protein
MQSKVESVKSFFIGNRKPIQEHIKAKKLLVTTCGVEEAKSIVIKDVAPIKKKIKKTTLLEGY